MTTPKFFIIAHNIRSLYNIGTIFRTADALAIDQLFLTGYSPCPPRPEISKVALGAEEFVPWQYFKSISYLFKKLKSQGVSIVALEIDKRAVNYLDFKPEFPLALVVGNEVRGVSKNLLNQVDEIIALPMKGKKESLNVGVAMAVAAYDILSKK